MPNVVEALQLLEEKSTAWDLANLARFGIVTADRVLGVSMSSIQAIAKQLGPRDPKLAAALWDTGCYEARMLTAFVHDPGKVAAAQMDRWCKQFDNWAICDTLCFKLWDRTPHAWSKAEQWSKKDGEFVKRAGFALLASMAGHDKKSGDDPFRDSLAWIERGAFDDRNFVKKGVSWALRRIGTRSAALKDSCIELAAQLAQSEDRGARWVGKDALRDLQKRK